LSGTFNLAAPNPVTNAEMMRTLRELCRVPIGLPASLWMLELGAFFLRTETELVLKSRRVVPGRLLRSGFTFEHPLLRPAFEDLLRRYR
jgi:NAD dependent epimerase/dehydratase family enzyme